MAQGEARCLLRRLCCTSTVVKVLETPRTSIDLDPGQYMAFFSFFLFRPYFVPVVEYYGLLQYGIAPLFRSKVLVRDSGKGCTIACCED